MKSETVDGAGRVGTRRRWARLAIGLTLVAIVAMAFTVVHEPMPTGRAAGGVTALPAPEVDYPAPAGNTTATAVLAGGCFWGIQGVFQHVKGVTAAESGYAGGARDTADYETVSTGDTGHAESVRITYDPTQVSFGRLLQIFFSVALDPTELNRQGPDHGTQYRSAIFAQNESQQRVADSYIAQLNRDAVFAGPIVTTVSSKTEFFPAERYHQDFLNSNPTYPYIAINDMPKVNDLKRLFPESYRDQPVLMLANGR